MKKTNIKKITNDDENIYEEHGFKNREDYLRTLADDNGVEYDVVLSYAMLLGEEEDFDGLLILLEDF